MRAHSVQAELHRYLSPFSSRMVLANLTVIAGSFLHGGSCRRSLTAFDKRCLIDERGLIIIYSGSGASAFSRSASSAARHSRSVATATPL